MTTKNKKCVRKKSHHWILPPPNGKESLGVCLYCKKTQIHLNSLDWTQWNGHGYLKPGGKKKSKK